MLRYFNIFRTQHVGCLLRSTSRAKNPVIALASKKFVIEKRNPKLGGTDSFTNGAKPTHGKPIRKKIRNLKRTAKITCKGGVVRKSRCICSPNKRRIKLSHPANHYVCTPAIPRKLMQKTKQQKSSSRKFSNRVKLGTINR